MLDAVAFDPDPRAVSEVLTIPVDFFIETLPEMHHLDVLQRQRTPATVWKRRSPRACRGQPRCVPIYRYDGRAIWDHGDAPARFSNIVRDALEINANRQELTKIRSALPVLWDLSARREKTQPRFPGCVLTLSAVGR